MPPLKPLSVLLVEDNDEHALIISRYLRRAKDVPKIDLKRLDRLQDAINKSQTTFFDIMLLDLRLPDSDMHETLSRVLKTNPNMPVIILSTLEDKEFALKKVHEGAQDYICKSDLTSETLVRSIYAAVERKASEVRLRQQMEQMQILSDFSKFAMSENYAEHNVEYLRQSALKGLGVSAVEVIRLKSEKVSAEFKKSPLWKKTEPALLHKTEITKQFPQFLNLPEDSFQSCLVFPIQLSNKSHHFGLLLLLNETARTFSEEEIRFAQSLVNTLSIALSRNFLYSELQQRVEQLDLAHRKKDDFLATLSHELRTPLNIIKGGIDLLKRSNPQSIEFDEAVGAIERGLNKEIQLVSDTLELSRITTGRMKLSTQKTVVQDIIRSVIDSLNEAAVANSIHVHFWSSEEQIVTILDPDRFRQVIWNLLSNAIKFTPKGGAVYIDCFRVGSVVNIKLKDTGQGIAAEYLPYVFEKFWQEDSGINRRRMGLGLGLSIVKHVVELHGGSVAVASPGKNQGTVFTVRIPVVTKETQSKISYQSQELINSSQEVLNGRGLLKGVRILLLDDSEDTLILMKRLLEKEGAQVTEHSHPKEALKALQSDNFDVLISDIGMPEMDGYEMLRAQRKWEQSTKRTKLIPAIALSAYTSEGDVRKALAAGFQLHMSKPSPIKTLRQQILHLVHRSNEEKIGPGENTKEN